MNPLSWIIVATLTFSTPFTDGLKSGLSKEDSGKKPTKGELLSPKEEAQWDKWENEWSREEKENEAEILIEWLPLSNSQMPHKGN